MRVEVHGDKSVGPLSGGGAGVRLCRTRGRLEASMERATPFVSSLSEIKGIDQTVTNFATVERAADVRLRARQSSWNIPR